MLTRKSGGITSALAAVIAASAVAASGATVTLAPPSGTTTNVLALYTGETSVEIAGPGTVALNPANTYTGGTTLSGGTLAYSGTYHDGVSPLGSGALNITGGTISGSGTIANDITATEAASFSPDGTIVLSGNNTITGALQVQTNTLEIAGGTTTVAGISLAPSSGTAHFRQSGGTVTLGANLQLSPVKGITSSYTMTGGTLDLQGDYKILVYGNKGSGASVSTLDVSGDAVIKNVSVLYIHKNFDKLTDSSFTINVHDGGRIGFLTTVYSSDSSVFGENFTVDGGILANDFAKGSSRTGWEWIDSVASIAVGPKGATFTTDNGNKAGMAQIKCPITAVAAAPGETAQGVTFNKGQWEFTAAGNAYEGPTVIKNGAVLFLDAKGTIPSTSTVTVGSGSELCAGGGNKTVTDLVLEKDAILGFGTSSSTPYTLTVTGSLALPAYAKIALYDSNAPVTTAVTAGGTYAVLNVPAACAAALAAVKWSCATATSGKSYTFSVTTSGDTATLSMTMAADSSGAITETSNLTADDYPVDSDITINNSGTLVAKKNIYGSATGGSITINDGGTLDASSGNIRPVDASGNSFHLYLNDGGALIVNQIHGVTSGAAMNEAVGTPMFHFNGGTIYPLAFGPNDANRYLLNFQTAVVGANGLTIDMSRWTRPEGYTKWVRSSVQGNVNHDPNCAGADGGIMVKATGDERALVCFGSRFAGSTLTGGIHVGDGGIIAVNAKAFDELLLVLEPGARFRPYDNNTVNIGNLTIGANGAYEAVRLDLPTGSVSAPGIAVSSTLSVLSPVEVAFTGNWNDDSTVSDGVYTALVYQAASPALDTSLFRAPPGFSISSETVAINTGDYNGYTALVLTLAQDDLSLDDSAEKTISADATYGDIYVGDSGTAANKLLLVTGGTITAGTLHLAHKPVDGADSSERHIATYVQSGGEVSVNTLYSMYRGSDSQSGRVSAEITLNGGALSVAGDARLGYNQTRQGYTTTITVKDGASMSVGGNLTLTYYSGTQMAPQGILNVNGGSLTVAGDIDLSRCANNVGAAFIQDGGVFLRGGVLSAANIVQTADYTPVQRLFFNGGTFAPNAAAAGRTLSGLTTAHVSTGGAIIDTSALPADATYTIAQALLTDPALDGAADGGFTKRGAGTLVLSGANTFTGPTRVEGGLLSITSGDAVSGDIAVSDGAALDLGGVSVSVGKIAASGLVRNGSLTVTGAIAANDAGSMLAVDGDLTLAPGVAVDFAGGNAEYRPIAAVSGTVAVPEMIKARNAGDFNRCKTSVIDGVVYVCPTTVGFTISVR